MYILQGTLLQAFEHVNPATCKRINTNPTCFSICMLNSVTVSHSSGENEVNVVLDVVSFLCDGQRKKLQDIFGREMPQLEVSASTFSVML